MDLWNIQKIQKLTKRKRGEKTPIIIMTSELNQKHSVSKIGHQKIFKEEYKNMEACRILSQLLIN